MIYLSTSGNNIYGSDVRETLLRLQKEGTDGSAAYILMQRIFPNVFPTFLMRDGICHKDHAISELGIYGAYLRYMCFAFIQCKAPPPPTLEIYMSLFVNHFYESILAVVFINNIFFQHTKQALRKAYSSGVSHLRST
jgi:hypothetical protein